MANTFKAISRAAATTSASTVYTVGSGITTLVNNVVVTNTAATAASFNILFNDVAIASGTNIPANESIVIELKQILESGNTIKTSASATTVNFHISGLEIG
jgi:hypothetical protein